LLVVIFSLLQSRYISKYRFEANKSLNALNFIEQFNYSQATIREILVTLIQENIAKDTS
jgi:DNA-binding GntR family transcriptional regulator